MGMFAGIMEKLGFDRGRAAANSATMPPATPRRMDAPRPAAAGAAGPAPEQTASSAAAGGASAGSPSAAPIDVMGKLESLSAASPQKLNWRHSIVDLMKLLGMDSTLTARKKLAVELGCPEEKLGDSAQMNTWLHKAVLQKLAENGGNIPQDLLH